jgi:GTP-binding protein Era
LPVRWPSNVGSRLSEETLVGELVCEAGLEGVEDELPHSIMVVVEEMGLREGRPADQSLLDMYASMIVAGYSRAALGHAIMPCKTLPVSAQR